MLEETEGAIKNGHLQHWVQRSKTIKTQKTKKRKKTDPPKKPWVNQDVRKG